MTGTIISKLYNEWLDDRKFNKRINQDDILFKSPERKLNLERLEQINRLLK